jgi:hypothetical protein
MFAFLTKLLPGPRSLLKSRACLEAENLVLRQQVTVLSRKSRSRVRLRNLDRLIFVWLYRFFPSILNAITVVKPETVIRWHRRGFRAYWCWKSRRSGAGHPFEQGFDLRLIPEKLTAPLRWRGGFRVERNLSCFN